MQLPQGRNERRSGGTGNSHVINVTWNTDKAGPFAQFITLRTNCPDKEEMVLWVKGTVATILNSSQGGVAIEDMVPGEARTQDFYLFSDLWDEVIVDRIETSSPLLNCEVIPSPVAEEEPKETIRIVQRATDSTPKPKSRKDFRMTAMARETSGVLRGWINVFVRPPKSGLESNESEVPSEYSLRGMANALQEDGTLLVHLPVETIVKRRLGLYSPIITDPEKRLVDLGKVVSAKSSGKPGSALPGFVAQSNRQIFRFGYGYSGHQRQRRKNGTYR